MNLKIVAKNTGDLRKFDIFGNLPKEICYKILFYLSPRDIVNSFRCCKKWQQHINYNFVWKQICEDVYSDSEDVTKTEVYKKFVQSHSDYWHGHLVYNRALKYNIKNNKYRKVGIKIEDTNLRFIHMDDRLIILASNFIFYIINSSTGLVERRIAFQNSLRAIKHGDYLIAVNRADELKVWNINDGTVFIDRRLVENAESIHTVISLLGCKHLIVFVMIDKVYTLDMRTGDFKHIGPGIYACCNNDLVAILERNNGNIVIKDSDLNGVTSFSYSRPGHNILGIRMNEDFLVKEYTDYLNCGHFLSIFNIKTKANFTITVNISYRFRSNFQISKNRLVHRTNSFTLTIWDMFTQKRLFKIDNNGSDVLGFTLHDSYIYIKFNSRKWQMWCLQTRKFVQDLTLNFTNPDTIAITNSKLLYPAWSIPYSYWEIHDFEANLLEQNK